MSLRILHVIPSVSPKHGGPSFALPLFTSAIARQGAEVTVATTDDDGPGARLDVPLGELVPGPGSASYIYFRKNTDFYRISRSLARWLRDHSRDFDVVHIHALFNFVSFTAARAAWRTGVPYVVRPLGVLNRYGLEKRRPILKHWSIRLIELPILRRAAAIHYTAEAERAEAASAHPDVAALNSVIIPIPVEMPAAGNSAAFSTRFPAASNRTIVLFLSRLDRKKGIELLLSAFSKMRAEFPNALLVLAGSGEESYVEELHEKAGELGCGADVLWPGFMSGEDKRALLEAATVFVLPSFSENFGIAAAEAMAAGVPSILSENVAVAPDAAAAHAAIMVPCEAFAIADAIRQLLGDPGLRARLGSRAKSFIQDRFSSSAIGIQLIDLYARLSKHPCESNHI